jgi:hypothetical protein
LKEISTQLRGLADAAVTADTGVQVIVRLEEQREFHGPDIRGGFDKPFFESETGVDAMSNEIRTNTPRSPQGETLLVIQ